jgi:hypothetical protein
MSENSPDPVPICPPLLELSSKLPPPKIPEDRASFRAADAAAASLLLDELLLEELAVDESVELLLSVVLLLIEVVLLLLAACSSASACFCASSSCCFFCIFCSSISACKFSFSACNVSMEFSKSAFSLDSAVISSSFDDMVSLFRLFDFLSESFHKEVFAYEKSTKGYFVDMSQKTKSRHQKSNRTIMVTMFF